MFNKFQFISLFFIIITTSGFAQDVVTLNPWDGDTLNYVDQQIVADTLANGGLLPNRVYELTRGELYFTRNILTLGPGLVLRLRASEGDEPKPIIYLDEVPGTERPAGNFIVLNGATVEMTNICVAGYYEFEPDRLGGIQGGLIQVGGVGSSVILDGVILSNTNGNHVRTNASTDKIQITNSIFANMGGLTRSNLGAGKGLDLRAVSHDTLIVENTTFVNYQDRAIRHLDLSDTLLGKIEYTRINHCTFVNGMGYHGLLSLGYVGSQVIITNNLFYDAFALGEDSTDDIRASEWLHTGETYPNGNNRMTWVITPPNDSTEWTVTNNYYVVTPEGQAWLDDEHFGHGPFEIGSPLSYHQNSKLGADSMNAFLKIEMELNEIPALMTNMMTWYEDTAGANRTKETGTFEVALHDFDRRTLQYYRDTMDCAYPQTSEAFTGGSDGLPAGDLKWWEGVVGIDEDEILPSAFTLDQNYPNPFNPSTKISFYLDKAGLTTLSVYNILGQKVSTLLAEDMSAGSHSLNFDASGLSTGVYFYKLESGNLTSVKKMMLLK